MDLDELTSTLLAKAIEHASRNDFEKCEHATRILLSLPRIESEDETQQPETIKTQKPKISKEQKELDEKEALENLELVDESYRGQLWMTVGEAEQAFNQPAHEIKRWIRCEEIEWQPRPSDKRGTKLVNSISVAARIDRGHCPPS